MAVQFIVPRRLFRSRHPGPGLGDRPAGWKVATALRPSGQTGNRIDYAVTSYEILMDSPLIAGEHYRAFPLAPTSLSTLSPTMRRSLPLSPNRSMRTNDWFSRR